MLTREWMDRQPSVYFGDFSPTPAAIESERILRGKRRFAKFVAILERRPPHAVDEGERTEVNCASCKHVGDHDGEKSMGYCMELRHMVSTWHPVLCNGYKRDA